MTVEELLQVLLDEHNRKQLFRYALQLTRNIEEAEDLFSDLVLAVYINPEMEKIREPIPYFRTCIRNRFYNLRQREKRMQYEDPQVLIGRKVESDEETIEAYLSEKETRAKLKTALADYSDEWIEAFEKFYLDGYSQTELSKEMGVKPNTISQQFRRMRKKLKMKYPILYLQVVFCIYL